MSEIYIAGVKPYTKHLIPEKSPVLLSWAYNVNKLFQYFYTLGHKIIIDSGAFTVWKSGGQLDKTGYFKWCKQNPSCEFFIAPDVIQGSEEDNLSNLHEMMQHVPKEKIMPVFHEGEDTSLLQKYIEMDFKRIGLGATVSRGKKELSIWLEKVFREHPYSYHGLAMTQPKLMKYYAGFFDSIDSTTWLCFAKYGLEANKYLLNNRSMEFYRKLGILVLSDLINEKNSEAMKVVQTEKVKTITNQLSIFDFIE